MLAAGILNDVAAQVGAFGTAGQIGNNTTLINGVSIDGAGSFALFLTFGEVGSFARPTRSQHTRT